MKKATLLITTFCLISVLMTAQNAANFTADSLAIIETARNYGDGFYLGDPERMEKAIHPDINKVSPLSLPETGKTFLMYSTYSGLIEMTRARIRLMSDTLRRTHVDVLKINKNVACVKLTSDDFNEYVEMAKIDKQWKIVNVLWTFGAKSPNHTPLTDFNGDAEKPAVEQAVRDMIEGLYTSDFLRVENALHPEYKRATLSFMTKTGKMIINRDAAGALVEGTRAKVGALDKEKWDIKIDVFDVMDGLAFAELTIPSSWSYCQLAKLEGQWKIINILRKPVIKQQNK
jgi:hypothetical protein